MSVTFDLAASDGEHLHIGIPCPLCETLSMEMCTAENGEPYEAAGERWYEHYENCPSRQWQVHTNNQSAHHILRELGLYADDLCGDLPGKQFLDLVVASNCHRREELVTLAVEAARRGISIGWG